jgi:hypothetical protein
VTQRLILERKVKMGTLYQSPEMFDINRRINEANKIKEMVEVDKAFGDFIGTQAMENDAGWSHEVWRAAWTACLNSAKQCNMCGSKVVHQVQPDLPEV